MNKLLNQHDRNAVSCGIDQPFKNGVNDYWSKAKREFIGDKDLRPNGQSAGQGQHLLLPPDIVPAS